MTAQRVSYETEMNPTITEREYRAFQHAYNFFNAELFGNSLPHVLVTLQRHARAKGYFAPERFAGRVEKVTAHELALNPDVFTGRSDELILSTLVHEMVHVWQQTYGRPPRRCYHDKEWAAKMKEIGLQPSTTGEPGGKETGQSVTHYLIPGGPFTRAYAKLAATGLTKLAVCSVRWRRAQEEGGQQNQVHLSYLWRERLGQTGYTTDLRCLLRRRRRRNRGYDVGNSARRTMGGGLSLRRVYFLHPAHLFAYQPSLKEVPRK